MRRLPGRRRFTFRRLLRERGWWPAHIANMNAMAVWSKTGWLQYRAVVVWKRQVRVAVRRQLALLGQERGNMATGIRGLLDIYEAFGQQIQSGQRVPFLCPEGGAEHPPVEEVNIGFDAWRISQQARNLQ